MNIINETTFADIHFLVCFLFHFQRKSPFNYKNKFFPSEKVALVEKELNGTDRDSSGNLGNSLRLDLINEECFNPNAVVAGEELSRSINQKKKPDVLIACRCPLL